MNKKEIEELIGKLLELNKEKSLNISLAKDLFFDLLKSRNTNPQTIQSYKNIFYRLDKCFAEQSILETKDIDDVFLQNMITNCLNKNLSANYINKLIGQTKFFIKTLSEANYISSFAFKTKKLKAVEKRIEAVNENDLIKILNYVKSQSLKIQLIVNLLLATGVRRSELSRIELTNIDLENNYLILTQTKSNKIRTCFYPDEIKLLMKQYINEYHPKTYLLEGANPGTPYAPRSISNTLQRIKECLNLERLSPHQFRHSFGTHIYNSSLDIELTRELLGHSNYMMTKRYVHQSKERLKKQYNLHNPIKSYFK